MHRCAPAVFCLLPLALAAHPCESCHPREVAAYAHSAMSRSLRPAADEPAGALTTVQGTRFTVRSGDGGTWQKIERAGRSAEYRVAYAIGSGAHATGYLIAIEGRLFQSPLCYYTSRREYGL